MSEEQQRAKDAHLGLRFWVEFDNNIEVAGFMECTGLSVETETFEYAEGGENTYTHKLPVRTTYGNVTLKRGIDPGQDFFRWYEDCINGNMTRKNISIMIYGPEPNKPAVRRWDLRRAFPVKWTGPDMRAESGAVAVETLELAHEGLIPVSSK